MRKQRNSSWDNVSDWYDNIVGSKGHFYHRELIFPNLKKKLTDKPKHLLDLACGQGAFSKALPKGLKYTGIDLSKNLIDKAKSSGSQGTFYCADVSEPLPINETFDAVSIILAIQDIPNFEGVIKNASKHLESKGKFYIVMNHPCFRIPRISSWGIDEGQNMLYRRVNSYLSEHKIPIQTKPSAGSQATTVTSHHRPLSSYVNAIGASGLAVTSIDEWACPKQSYGKNGKRENRARKEFPMFLCIEAIKL